MKTNCVTEILKKKVIRKVVKSFRVISFNLLSHLIMHKMLQSHLYNAMKIGVMTESNEQNIKKWTVKSQKSEKARKITFLFSVLLGCSFAPWNQIMWPIMLGQQSIWICLSLKSSRTIRVKISFCYVGCFFGALLSLILFLCAWFL